MAGGGSHIALRTTFTPSVEGLEGGRPLEVAISANSSNAEADFTADNHALIQIPVIVETSIILRG